ncbi:MAG: hypothetical protein DRK00_02510 [Thermoprotei archaeon]|nr:MAG: hypothetical protein DRK00_02510 [Thermoprotei archaeon]HDD34088.1 DUF2075 domain-containing protein [Thermofilaceae archaeon]
MTAILLEDCPSGIPGFDEATGGFYRGQLVLVAGNAGSGKTTFAAKFIYEGAKRWGEPGLYISTGESKEEFYAYMARLGMDFKALEERGLFRYVLFPTPTSTDALMNLSKELVSNAMEIKAKRVVIDSITPFLTLSPPLEVRAMLHNALKTITRTLKATTVLTVEVPRGRESIGAEVEEFVCDALIKLTLVVPEAGAPYRMMRVLKLRGRPLSRVAYEYEIGPPFGIRVLPTSLLEELESKISRLDRVPTGVKGLDEMLGGGLIRGTVVLIEGPPGSGKTLLALLIAAENSARGLETAYVSFEEPRQQLEETLRFLGYKPERLEKLSISSISPRALTLRGIYNVAEALHTLDRRVDLMILDGLTALSREFGSAFAQVMREIAFSAKRRGCTLIVTMISGLAVLNTIADTLIRLRVKEEEGELRRELAVVKMRMYSPEPKYRELKLVGNKLVVT